MANSSIKPLYVYTVSYNNSRVVRDSIKKLYETLSVDKQRVQHHFLDNHYPINHSESLKENKKICQDYNINYYDPGTNLGITGGYDYLCREVVSNINIDENNKNSIVIHYDSNSYPINPGFGNKFEEVFLEDEECAMASLAISSDGRSSISGVLKLSWFDSLKEFYKGGVVSFRFVDQKKYIEEVLKIRPSTLEITDCQPYSSTYGDLYNWFISLPKVFKVFKNGHLYRLLNYKEDIDYYANIGMEDKEYTAYKRYIPKTIKNITFEEFLKSPLSLEKIALMTRPSLENKLLNFHL